MQQIPIKVIRRALCGCSDYEYSIDGCETWMSSAEYYTFKQSLIQEMWK